MRLPVITKELTLRIEEAWAAERRARATVAMSQAGNPLLTGVRQFGNATAVRAERNPSSQWMNRVVNLTTDDLRFVDEVLEYYRSVGARGHIELCPGTSSFELLDALSRRGAYQTCFHAVTYGVPTGEVPPLPPGVEVRPVGAEEIDDFLIANFTGFGYTLKPEMVPNFRAWRELPGWHLYLATVDGHLAGTAIMCVYDGVGYMASASTLEQWRGRGVQKALLYQRIADAAALGCDLMTGQCTFGSISHQNQERCGLRLAYTKAVWASHRSE